LIDTRKVTAVTSVCPDTNDALAAAVDDALLSTAVRADGSTALAQTITETPRVLGLRTQRVLSALDPSWVRAVRRAALSRRRLAKGSYGMGVGYLGLYDVGVPGLAAAYEHVNAIARGIKHLGDTRTLDQLRADTALDLLTGGTSPIHQPTPTTAKPATARPASARAATDKDNDEPEQERPDENEATDGSTAADVTTTAADADADVTPERPTPAPRARADVDLIVHLNTLADLADAASSSTSAASDSSPPMSPPGW